MQCARGSAGIKRLAARGFPVGPAGGRDGRSGQSGRRAAVVTEIPSLFKHIPGITDSLCSFVVKGFGFGLAKPTAKKPNSQIAKSRCVLFSLHNALESGLGRQDLQVGVLGQGLRVFQSAV